VDRQTLPGQCLLIWIYSGRTYSTEKINNTVEKTDFL
jgi:hypothetical protein